MSKVEMLRKVSKREYERCLRCGRMLRAPFAREIGMGPVCYKKYLAEKEHKKLF